MLVVENEPMLRDAVAGLLRDQGYVPAEAANGAVALEIALSFRPDVVVFDWATPIADGRALVGSIRELMRPLPGFVAVSAVREARAWCDDNGVPFVVAKPFEDATLLRAVEGALARVREERAPRRKPPRSDGRVASRPACVVAVGEHGAEESLVEELPESLRRARIVVVDEAADAERVLELIVPDLVVVDDDIENDRLRALATSKAIPVLVRPTGARSSTRVATAPPLDEVGKR